VQFSPHLRQAACAITIFWLFGQRKNTSAKRKEKEGGLFRLCRKEKRKNKNDYGLRRAKGCPKKPLKAKEKKKSRKRNRKKQLKKMPRSGKKEGAKKMLAAKPQRKNLIRLFLF